MFRWKGATDMLYSVYELNHAMLAPARAAASFSANLARSPLNPARETLAGRSFAAALDIFEAATRRYGKPEWRIRSTEICGQSVPVEIDVVAEKTFCRLLHFRRDRQALDAARGGGAPDPRVLLVAPLSGHYATLLRGTVEAMLPGHEVYITDWIDARLAPVFKGRFDLNDYIDYIIEFLQGLGAGAHVISVCQPGPAVLSAIALMSEDQDPNLPATMTYMGSPIDARKSPTTPNLLALEKPYEWFRDHVISTVPPPYPGMLRRVYPGFLQLTSFISMNHERHLKAQYEYYEHLVANDGDSARKHREFYDEYLSVMDLTEEFYLQTIRDVFQEFSLPRGVFAHHGRIVDPAAITEVALLTIEGENDDISGIGQTQAAHDLCTNIPLEMKQDYIQKDVGHYGVFNGSRWRNEIQPRLAAFIAKYFDRRAEAGARPFAQV